MTRVINRIGPQDNGRRMTLEEFASIEAQPGYLYELGRGTVIVTDIPNPKHFAQVMAAKRQLWGYDAAHPGKIFGIAGGGECKILLDDLASERHPDIAVYSTAPLAEQDVWATWIPEIVIEVISPGSEHRDYVEKREEYLQFGIREYWIIDADKRQMLVLRRAGGRWSERIVRPGDVYRTRLLPGFQFDLNAVFEAIAAA